MLLQFPKGRYKGIATQIVEFKMGERLLGVEVSKVVEIVNARNLSAVPESDTFLKGIINVRGSVLPVISLGSRLGLEPLPLSSLSRVIILDILGLNVGMLVDSVVLALQNTGGARVMNQADGVPNEFVQFTVEINEMAIPILNVERLLAEDEKKKLENLRQTF